VIATGSKPHRLPFSGAELMITSDDMLSENALPETVHPLGFGVQLGDCVRIHIGGQVRQLKRTRITSIGRASGRSRPRRHDQL
jgi:hypothetical protein